MSDELAFPIDHLAPTLSVLDLQRRDLLLLQLREIHGEPRYDIAKELRKPRKEPKP